TALSAYLSTRDILLGATQGSSSDMRLTCPTRRSADWRQPLPKIHNPFCFGEPPRQVGCLRRAVFYLCIGSKFLKAQCREKALDIGDDLSADSAAPERPIDPNTFKKGDRPALAAIGIFSYRYFSETNGSPV